MATHKKIIGDDKVAFKLWFLPSSVQTLLHRSNYMHVLRAYADMTASTQRHIDYRATQREYSSKPLKHSIVKRVLVFKQWIWAYFYAL